MPDRSQTIDADHEATVDIDGHTIGTGQSAGQLDEDAGSGDLAASLNRNSPNAVAAGNRYIK